LGIYGALDNRVTGSQPAAKAALDRARLVNELVVEPNADHAFFNDTGPRYNAAAAADAWQRTLDWFGRYLAGERLEIDGNPRPRRPQRHRQLRPSPQHPGGPPVSGTRRPHLGEPLEERPQPDFALGASQGSAQAEVPAAGEREMLSGIGPFDVEAVRVGEYRRVPVGGGQIDHHQLATADRHPCHLDIVAGDPRGEL